MENEIVNKKDTSKEKIILFVIGVLVGAVISASSFFVYVKTLGISTNTGTNSSDMPSQQTQVNTPPEKPSDDNKSQSNN